MSRIGRAPVNFGKDVQVSLSGSQLAVKGPTGQLEMSIVDGITAEVNEGAIVFSRPSDHRRFRSLHGMTRSIAANMVEGVTKGFSRNLEIRGVGFRAILKGSKLEMNLGKSHMINLDIPANIKVEIGKEQRNVTVSGVDNQEVGAFAAKIRSFHPPEPYKGKGVRYVGEHVRSKEGKSGK